MTYSRYTPPALLLIIFLGACKPPAQQQAGGIAGPAVRATVVTIRTSVEPTKETLTHRLVIAGDRVRSTDERDSWRIFHPESGRVTFVDDVAKTFRTEPMEAVESRRRTATSDSLPPHYPRPRITAGGASRSIQGASAERHVIEAGAYRRELWIGEHPAIPPRLFSMMHASESPSSPLIAMMRGVDDVLMKTGGFPLIDRTEVTFGEQKTVIERTVTSVQQESVPAALIEIPDDYVDLTPQTQNNSRRK